MNPSIRDEFDLEESDLQKLAVLERSLPYYADLLGADLFLGCFRPGKKVSVVVGEASPLYSRSNYSGSVLGQEATPENEPALFTAKDLKTPVYDILAVTQENNHVRQDVLPLMNASGEVFATLICERDVSRDVRQEHKYEEMVRRMSTGEKNDFSLNHLTEKREIHHRIKNNLQMMASILSMQSRRMEDPAVRQVFQENTSRILSIAEIYDLLVASDSSDMVSLLDLCHRIRQNVLSCMTGQKNISLEVCGEDILLPSDKATVAAIVVNELLTNAVEHAFHGRTEGRVLIKLQRGVSRFIIMVEDNGIGFDVANIRKGSFGLDYVKATVEERLNGIVRIVSDSSGSRVLFDFAIEDG